MKIHSATRSAVALCASIALLFLCGAANAADGVTPRDALKGVDIVDEQQHYNEVVFDVAVTPEDMHHHAQPFCARLITTLWLSDDEITQASNSASLFDILKRKFAARTNSTELEQHFSLFRRLSALGYLASQGSMQVVENNVQNETKNLRFNKRLSVGIVDRHMWDQLVSSADECSLTISDGACSETDEAESVDLDTDSEAAQYEAIVFPSTLDNEHGADVTPSTSSVEEAPSVDETESREESEPLTSSESSTLTGGSDSASSGESSSSSSSELTSADSGSTDSGSGDATYSSPSTSESTSATGSDSMSTDSLSAGSSDMTEAESSTTETATTTDSSTTETTSSTADGTTESGSSEADTGATSGDTTSSTESGTTSNDSESTDSSSGSSQTEEDVAKTVVEGTAEEDAGTAETQGETHAPVDTMAGETEGAKDGQLVAVGNPVAVEQSTEEKPKHVYTPLTEAEETKMMDLFIALDMQDNPTEKVYPVMVTIKAHVLSNTGTGHRDIDTYTSVLIPENAFKACESEDYNKCLFTIRDKLFDRYESEASKRFVRGRFISLLQSLMLQYNVYVRHDEKNANGIFELFVYLSVYTTKFVNFPAWSKIMGDAHSTDRRLELGMSFSPEAFAKPNSAKLVYLGMGYNCVKYENKFMKEYPELELGDTFLQKGSMETDFTVKHPEKSVVDSTPKVQEEEKAESGPTPKPKEEQKPESREDMHRMVSAYERALLQVPKEINGYKLEFKDIEKYPELQRIWKMGLVTIGQMKEEDDLKEFLDKHTFTYDRLKSLFNFTYGIIAMNNYEECREFYESAKITREAVETSITMVQNMFRANTGTNITRLPPVVKQMAHTCPVKDMIISLSTDDLIDRMQIMMGSWMEAFAHDIMPEGDFQLAALCSASAIFVQQWMYLQRSQGYHEEGIAWGLLLQSFSKMGQSSHEDPEVKNKFKKMINSSAAKVCRKYINQAGSIASTPYKGITRNYEPKSLSGAIGNVLDLNMESDVTEIVSSLQTYFSTANKKNRVGSAIGVCMSLQILDRMHKCLSVENSNDYSLYKLDLLTQDGAHILESLTSANIQIRGKAKETTNFIYRACDPRDPVVEEVVDKLFKLFSNEAHGIIMGVLEKRNYHHPKIGKFGEIVEDINDLDLTGSEYVELEDSDAFTQAFMTSDAESGAPPDLSSTASFLDIHETPEEPELMDDVDDDYDASEDMDMAATVDEETPMTSVDASSSKSHPLKTEEPEQQHGATLYDKLISKYTSKGIADPADMRTVNFDFRMVPKFGPDDSTIKSIMVPLSFHKQEVEYLALLKTMEFLYVLIRKVEERIVELKRQMPTNDMLHHVRAISNLQNKDEVTLSVDKNTVNVNRQLNEINRLITVLTELPHDGFYFEHEDGRELPRHDIGRVMAKTIAHVAHKPQVMIMQIIDPVHIADNDELFVK